MSPRSFGIEAITDEDRAYGGSRFSDVREALFANPYQRTWGADGEPPLPVHPVTLSSLLYGILPFGPPYVFRQATERAVDSAAHTCRFRNLEPVPTPAATPIGELRHARKALGV